MGTGMKMDGMKMGPAATGRTKPAGGAKGAASFVTQLKSDPSPAVPGQPVTLTLQISGKDGKPVTSFDTLHTKPMHLIAVSDDLGDLQHLHPTLKKDGTFEVKTTFTKAQPYTLVAEYEPKGKSEQTIALPLALRGGKAAKPDLAAEVDASRKAGYARDVGGAHVVLEGADGAKHGKKVTLHLHVTDPATGKPMQLQSWLGMPAHAIVFSQDKKTFLHLHGMAAGMKMGGMDMDAMDMGGMQMGASGKDIAIEAIFTKAGDYKVFVQFEVKGKVQTVPFALRVG